MELEDFHLRIKRDKESKLLENRLREEEEWLQEEAQPCKEEVLRANVFLTMTSPSAIARLRS